MSLYWKLTNLNYTLLASLATCFSHFCSGCNVAFNDEQITIAPQSELTPRRTYEKESWSFKGGKKNERMPFFAASTGHSSTIAPWLKNFKKPYGLTYIAIANHRYLFINIIIRQLSSQPLIERWKTYQRNIQKKIISSCPLQLPAVLQAD